MLCYAIASSDAERISKLALKLASEECGQIPEEHHRPHLLGTGDGHSIHSSAPDNVQKVYITARSREEVLKLILLNGD